MAAGAAAGTLALTVPPNASEDGCGELSEDGSCVMFRDCGTALTSVCVASGVRVAFFLVTKGDRWGVVGTAPQAAACYKDFGDHQGACAVYSDGGLQEHRNMNAGIGKNNVLRGFDEGDILILEGLLDSKARMLVNGRLHYEWRFQEGDCFAVSGINGTKWRLKQLQGEPLALPPVPPAPPAPAVPLVPAPPELLEAARKGDSREIERQIADGADVRHEALMHAAVGRGHVKVLQVLLAAGAAPTPLHTAGNLKVVQVLLEAGANLEARQGGWFGAAAQTPLQTAAEAGNEKVVQALCAAGADMEAPANGCHVKGGTAMHLAVKHPKVLKVLLATGASDAALTFNGETPLKLAQRLHKVKLVPKRAVTLLEKVAQEREGSAAKKQRLEDSASEGAAGGKKRALAGGASSSGLVPKRSRSGASSSSSSAEAMASSSDSECEEQPGGSAAEADPLV
jgi:hypothetical protein